MLFLNQTEDIDESNYSYIEPVPNWTMIAATVGNGFVLFKVIGVVFLITHAVCISLLPQLCRRHANRRYHITQVLTVAICSISLGVCLTVDPYARWRKLPVFMNNILEQIGDPCVVVAFFSLQSSIVNLVSINISCNKLQSCGRLYAILMFYIASLLLFETIVCYNFHLSSLRLLAKLQLVIFSMYSCVCFLCTGFKVAIYLDFVKSPNKLKDILIDNQTETEADSKSLLRNSSEKLLAVAPCTPVIPVDQIQLRSVYTTSESSDTDTVVNLKRKSRRAKSKRQRQDSKGTDLVKTAKKTGIKLKQFHTNKSSKNKCDTLSSSVIENSPVCSTLSEHMSHTEIGDSLRGREGTIGSVCNRTGFQASATIVNRGLNINTNDISTLNTTQGEDGVLFYNSSEDNRKLLREFGTKHKQISDNDPQSLSIDNVITQNETLVHDDDDDLSSFGDSSDDDNGYLADGENANTGTKQHSVDGDSIYSHFTDVHENPLHSFKGTALAIPSTRSLVRIRQSTLLQRLITVAYFTTFTLVVNTIFHLYSVFGVYGIFGTHKTPKPWPWFLFQILHRLVEITLTSSLLLAIVMTLWFKPRRRKNHSQKNTA